MTVLREGWATYINAANLSGSKRLSLDSLAVQNKVVVVNDDE